MKCKNTRLSSFLARIRTGYENNPSIKNAVDGIEEGLQKKAVLAKGTTVMISSEQLAEELLRG